MRYLLFLALQINGGGVLRDRAVNVDRVRHKYVSNLILLCSLVTGFQGTFVILAPISARNLSSFPKLV